jgi:O-antigen/teichoic acid export membrane protein
LRALIQVRPGPRTARVARNALVVAIAETAGKAATFALTVTAARALGAAGFGAFASALPFALLAATLPHWGFAAYLVTEGSRDRRRLPALFIQTVVWRALLAVPVLLLGMTVAVTARPDRQSGIALVLVLVAALVDEICMTTARAVADALQEQGWASRALVLERIGQATFGIAALLAGLGLVGLAAGYLGGTIVGALVVLRGVRKAGVSADLELVRRSSLLTTLRLTSAYGVNVILAMALFRVDQVLLSALKGDATLGPYAAAYRLIETVMFISWAAARAMFPAMSSSTEAWQVLRGVEQSVGVVAVLYVPFAVGLTLEAEAVVEKLFGVSYTAAAVPATRWLAITPILFAVGFFAMHAIVARGLRWVIVLGTAMGLFVNVVSNLLLIPALAGTGAAIATVLSYLVQAAVFIALLARTAGWARLHRALAVPVAAAVPFAAVLALLHLDVLLEAAVGAAVYATTWLVLARRFVPEQIGMIASALHLRGGT